MKKKNICHETASLSSYATLGTIKGRKIAKENDAPFFPRSAAWYFIKKYGLKVRRTQRKKQVDKFAYSDKLKEWHLKFREGLIKSHSNQPNYDQKWGRFKPHQRLNVDQAWTL